MPGRWCGSTPPPRGKQDHGKRVPSAASAGRPPRRDGVTLGEGIFAPYSWSVPSWQSSLCTAERTGSLCLPTRLQRGRGRRGRRLRWSRQRTVGYHPGREATNYRPRRLRSKKTGQREKGVGRRRTTIHYRYGSRRTCAAHIRRSVEGSEHAELVPRTEGERQGPQRGRASEGPW